MMRAVVVKPFHGVVDGEVHPKHHKEGDIVEGDLAKVALEEKWAVEEGKKPKAEPKTEKKAEKPAESKPAKDVPADWKTFTSDKLKALAKELTGTEAKDDASAKAAIEAEVAKRATPKA